ncbi:MAG: peptidoglycan-binding protein [Hyphomicrobiales bacterium]|nr:peptidoglycan-binding protein [Hyphomicrobiales bacterium]MBV8825879.1 peptidoglycan-binding protein [Hyphomicrobiales bacterium]MBV9428300.1 peptidoglycan-binding protein [Bradyrhizobiaceae bacterium]
MSSRIDTLEPNREPLAHLLASIVTQLSGQDFVKPYALSFDTNAAGDIARHAQLAIAGIPPGIEQASPWPELIASLRSVFAAGIRPVAPLLPQARHALARVVPIVRNLHTPALDAIRRHGAPVLRLRPRAIPGNAAVKTGAALAVAVLGAVGGLIYASGRFTPSLPPLDPPIAHTQPAAAEQFAEERPLRDSKLEFTRANLRYCTFEQIRLEALGPITEGADLLVFNALVQDWNSRCTKFRYRSEDKDAVDAQAGRRRALLEVEGRALMNGWRRKIVTTVQQRPAFAGLESIDAIPTGADAALMPGQTSDAAEPLPLLITLGRSAADDADRDTGLSLRTPSLALMRADVATRVQRRLNDLGYSIAVDGTWGTGSRAALRRFKRANGLLGNDAFDAESVTRLFSTSAVAAAGQHDDATAAIETIYPPPRDADMNPLNRAEGQRIQQRLAQLGYYNGRGDGAWDTAARIALRKFKAANGLGNNEDWDGPVEAALFDEQAVRATEAGPSDLRKIAAPSAAAAVPLPPKRPMPPAKAVPTPARGAASRTSP